MTTAASPSGTSSLATAVEPAPRMPATATSTDGTDFIPTENRAADGGCLDKPGALDATADGWYPTTGGSALGLNGARGAGVALTRFQQSAEEAVGRIAPSFDLDSGLEYRVRRRGCATHRYALFADGGDEILVSAWRVESAADRHWLPNEAAFVSVDDYTLVSRGDHIAVVLAVAPDGTTARVSAYGARARGRAAGWPTTAPRPPSAPEPGPVAVTVEDLIPVARAVLAFVLDQR